MWGHKEGLKKAAGWWGTVKSFLGIRMCGTSCLDCSNGSQPRILDILVVHCVRSGTSMAQQIEWHQFL